MKLVAEGSGTNAEGVGGVGAVAVAAFECLKDQLLFHLANRGAHDDAA